MSFYACWQVVRRPGIIPAHKIPMSKPHEKNNDLQNKQIPSETTALLLETGGKSIDVGVVVVPETFRHCTSDGPKNGDSNRTTNEPPITVAFALSHSPQSDAYLLLQCTRISRINCAEVTPRRVTVGIRLVSTEFGYI